MNYKTSFVICNDYDYSNDRVDWNSQGDCNDHIDSNDQGDCKNDSDCNYYVTITLCIVSKMKTTRAKLVPIFNNLIMKAHAPYINRGYDV